MKQASLLGVLILFSAVCAACSGSPTETPDPTPTATPVFSDSFTGADSATLGSGWTEVAGFTDFTISGNQLHPTGGGFGLAFWNTSTAHDDVSTSVALEIRGAAAPALQVHLVSRSQSKDNLDNAYTCTLIADKVQIFKIVSGSNSSLVAGSQTIPEAAGTALTLTFNTNGNVLTCAVGGAVSETVIITDSTFAAGGYYGIGAGDSGGGIYLDDFSITEN